MKSFIRVLLLLAVIVICLVVGAVFSVKNSQPVVVDFYITSIPAPMALWMALCLLLGALMSWAALSWRLLRLTIDTRRLARKVESANKELANIRALPAKDAF